MRLGPSRLPESALGDFPASRLVPVPESARRVASAILAVLALLVAAAALAPWRQSVSGEGRVIAFAPLERRQDVEAPIAGRVAHFYVDEGTVVREGDPLVAIRDNDPEVLSRYDAERQALEMRLLSYRSRADVLRERMISVSSSQEAAVAHNLARVQVAEERKRAAEETVRAAEAAREAAELQSERQERLVGEGLVSQRDVELARVSLARARTDLETARATARAAASELDAARAALTQARADATAREQEAEAAFESAEVDVAGAQAAIQRLEITIARQDNQIVRAPRAGTVYRLLVRVGSEQVSPGDPLLTLVPNGDRRAVELWVDGNDAPLVARGRRVRLQFEGWPAVQFTGWPSVAVGTFGGRVAFVDATDDGNGSFRIVVEPDPRQPRWPGNAVLRQGVRTKGWILLDEVRLGFELWRRFNGFPPSVRIPVSERPAGQGAYGGGTKNKGSYGAGGSSSSTYGGSP